MEAAFDELRASLARNLERGRKQDPLARVERRLAQPKTA
jgi:hypothetical protein